MKDMIDTLFNTRLAPKHYMSPGGYDLYVLASTNIFVNHIPLRNYFTVEDSLNIVIWQLWNQGKEGWQSLV